VNTIPNLRHALSQERKVHTGNAGRISYYVRGQGRPLLLLHSINAAASAYEVRPIYEDPLASFRIYAPDLPGFGLSDRSARRYDVAPSVAAIDDMLTVIAQDYDDQPVDIVALSLSCEFAARVALLQPHRIGRLVFITPTGFQQGGGELRQAAGSTREIKGLSSILSLPILSDGLFAALRSRPSIRFFLKKTWGSDAIDEGLVAYAHETARQPGAKHAPLAFLSGRLFSADVRTLYEALTSPIWMPHATRGDFSDFSAADWVGSRPNWKKQAFSTGALVHFEQPRQFKAGLANFLSRTPHHIEVQPLASGVADHF
jgi:pimeloyl-ACP methyl ester carboxylesterase